MTCGLTGNLAGKYINRFPCNKIYNPTHSVAAINRGTGPFKNFNTFDIFGIYTVPVDAAAVGFVYGHTVYKHQGTALLKRTEAPEPDDRAHLTDTCTA